MSQSELIPMDVSPSDRQLREADMLALIEKKYSENPGNGPAWAVVPHVRDAAGFDSKRTADAIVMSMWPSRGLVLHGFEIKVSRGDWLRELKKPEKAEVFCKLVDFWWVAVPDKAIVKDGELPDGWGLMVPDKRGLTVKVQARPLHNGGVGTKEKPVSRSFLAALLRSAARRQAAGPLEIQEAVAKVRDELSAIHRRSLELETERYNELERKVRAFEQEAGIQIGSRWAHTTTPEEMGRTVKLVLQGDADVERAENRLRALARQARDLAEDLDAKLPPKQEADGFPPPLVRSTRRDFG